MPDPASSPALPVSRRAVVVGAGALGAGLIVAGCASTTTTPAEAPSAADGPAGTALGPAADVPVGSAKIYDAQGVVVTQAAAGTFAAFSTACPHQGCAVSRVDGDVLVCPCHGSTFALDGSVTKGPATSGLQDRAVTVETGQITLA